MNFKTLAFHSYPKAKLVITFICSVFFSNTINAQPTLKICHENNHYPPYIYLDDAKLSGILIEIIKLASKQTQFKVEFYAKPWARCQKDVKAGTAHALFAMISTHERQQDFAFPPNAQLQNWHLWTAQYPVFTPINNKFDIDNYRPQKGIGAPRGYVVWQKLQEKNWLSPYQYEAVEGLNMLAINKLDGYVVERLIGLNLMNENNLSNKIKMSEFSMLDTRWYAPFNKNYYKNNREQVHIFWQKLASARKDLEQKYRLNNN